MTVSGWGLGEWSDMGWGTGVDYPYAPIDISYVTCTYVSSERFTATYKQLAVTLSYKPNIPVIPSARTQTIARTVTNTPSLAKHAAYVPSIQKVGSP